MSDKLSYRKSVGGGNT